MHRDIANLPQRIHVTIQERLLPLLHVERVPATVTARVLPGEPEPFEDAIDGEFSSFDPGTWWGLPWSTTWLRVEAIAPERRDGHRREVIVDLGFDGDDPGFQSEGLAYDTDGRILKGIAPRNAYVPVPDDVAPGTPWTFYIEAAANPRVRTRTQAMHGDLATAPEEPLYQFRHVDAALRDDDVFGLILDMQVLHELQETLDDGSPRKHRIIQGLSDAVDELGARDMAGRAAAARAILRPLLDSPAHASAHRTTGVGHAHIDSAWLWPIRETKRKCARTFSNVVALAADYPELRFACSSAQQYQWMKESYPQVFDAVARSVATGQFVPVGGMWVESDTNMPGSEGLARQFVQGQRFFEREFGITCGEVWLPDSFGYTAALPQIARLAEARWMLSQKMSWNQTNRFPHSTFWWEGLDGTRIFTHFPPSDTYNARISAEELDRGSRQFQERGRANSSIMPFGHGDGGGGPTREMLEVARRVADLEGSPRFELRSPAEFFADAEDEYPQAPVWAGEMYLEFHRGTYTSQIAMKQGNRAMEYLLTEAEHWAARAALECGADYPYDELDELWQEALLYQFHDILPGSSIAWVHREARERFGVLRERAQRIIDDALARLTGPGDTVVLVNPAPLPQHGLPAFGSGKASDPGPVRISRDRDTITLDNGLVRVIVDGDGLLTSAVELSTGREALSVRGNLLQLHPDQPNRYDAWDLDEFYLNRVEDLATATSVTLDDTDPLAPSVRVEREFHDSSVVQTMTLQAGARRIDCVTDVDWQEREHVLKAAFPTTVHTKDVTCDIQYGHLRRPVHRNTSWEAAQFEICAHKFVHVEEPGFGVALVNRGTYGHDVSRPATGESRGALPTTVRLTLARGPVFPDPFTDRGRHRFEYSLVVGAGIEEAVAEGWAAAMPVRELRGGHDVEPLLEVSDGVVVTAIKLADDRSGDLVIRCHEALGRRTKASITLSRDFCEACVVNLLERTDGEVEHLTTLTVDGRELSFPLTPFQIVTLRMSSKSRNRAS